MSGRGRSPDEANLRSPIWTASHAIGSPGASSMQGCVPVQREARPCLRESGAIAGSSDALARSSASGPSSSTSRPSPRSEERARSLPLRGLCACEILQEDGFARADHLHAEAGRGRNARRGRGRSDQPRRRQVRCFSARRRRPTILRSGLQPRLRRPGATWSSRRPRPGAKSRSGGGARGANREGPRGRDPHRRGRCIGADE